MPLYEYQCDACGFRFEVIQRFSDLPVSECQSCGGPVRRLLSPPAIQFKGSGWYVTDYARKGTTDASETKDKAPAAKADADKAKAGAPADSAKSTAASASD